MSISTSIPKHQMGKENNRDGARNKTRVKPRGQFFSSRRPQRYLNLFLFCKAFDVRCIDVQFIRAELFIQADIL